VLLADRSRDARSSQFLVEHIANARLATFRARINISACITAEICALIEEILTGTRPVPVSDRILATVCLPTSRFNRRLATLGDQAWRALLDRHDAMVRAQLRISGPSGQHYGDGFLATFGRSGTRGAVRASDR